MSLPTGLRLRSGVWQLRIGVPADLVHLYPGPDAYRGSLKTRDRSEATTKAHALLAQYRNTFDSQRTAEVVRRAPPTVPMTPDLESYLSAQAGWLALVSDDVVRFTPGMVEQVAPAIQFLTAPDLQRPPSTPQASSARWGRIQALALDQAKADLAAGRLTQVQQAAQADLQAMGVRVDWEDTASRLALARIARAQVRAFQQTVERSQGEPHDTPAKPVAPVTTEAPAAPATSSDTLRDVMPDWVARTKAKANAQQRTSKALALWEEAVGVVALAEVSRATGAAYVAFLLDPEQPFGSSTAANHAAAINALMNTAVKVGKVDRNPLDLSFKITGAERRLPWTTEELSAIFDSSLFSDNPPAQPWDVDPADARLWLWLLLWSGATAGEIAQARLQDVQDRDGVLCLRITKEAGTSKSDFRERWLPVAQALQPLLEAHVLLRRQQGSTVLLPSFHRRPGTSPADLASRWFRRFRVTVALPDGHLNGSHRFRHSISTRLAELGVGQEVGDQLTGHSSRGSTRSRVYTGTIRAPVLAEVVNRLAWPWPVAPKPHPATPNDSLALP